MNHKIAVMQPYFFPYIGYFQLVSAVDEFVFYDDATFIKQGWINRNVLEARDGFHYFSIPIRHASSFVKINQTMIREEAYGFWKRKLERTIKSNYSRSPHLDLAIRLLRRALREQPGNIAEIASTSVVACAEVLGLAPVFRYSSVDYPAQDMQGQQRILDICERSRAGTYINMAGGRKLYSREVFAGRSIGLQFLTPDASVSAQGARPESVLGMLLRDGHRAVRPWLGRYTLD